MITTLRRTCENPLCMSASISVSKGQRGLGNTKLHLSKQAETTLVELRLGCVASISLNAERILVISCIPQNVADFFTIWAKLTTCEKPIQPWTNGECSAAVFRVKPGGVTDLFEPAFDTSSQLVRWMKQGLLYYQGRDHGANRKEKLDTYSVRNRAKQRRIRRKS